MSFDSKYLMTDSSFARAIRGARGALNWSQADLAKACGISTPSIARIELGAKHKASTRVKIFDGLEVHGVYFVWDGDFLTMDVDLSKNS